MFATANPDPNRQGETRLQGRVGNGRTNHPEDVLWVKTALGLLGRYWEREPDGYITRKLDDAIQAYQRDRGLRRDGYLDPGGETECALCVELARVAGRARP